MSEQKNDPPLPLGHPDRFTGQILKRTRPRTYQRAIELIAQDVPADHIAKQLKISRNTIAGIKILQAETIEQKKRILAFAFAEATETGLDLMHKAMPKMSHRDLIIATGVSGTKLTDLTSSGPEVAVAIQINPDQSQVISAALKHLMPPEIES